MIHESILCLVSLKKEKRDKSIWGDSHHHLLLHSLLLCLHFLHHFDHFLLRGHNFVDFV